MCPTSGFDDREIERKERKNTFAHKIKHIDPYG